MTEKTYQVRLQSGHIGTVKCFMKPNELIGKTVMIKFESDGVEYMTTGVVEHIFEQLELEV